MSNKRKRDFMTAVRSAMQAFPSAVDLFQELVNNFAALPPAGSDDVNWRNNMFVDPVGGNNATAVPGSLKFTYKDLQPAFNAARAVLLLGALEASVVALPGTHDLNAGVGTGQIVWPGDVTGLHLFGFDRINTIITNDGAQDIITCTVTGDNFKGSIANVQLSTAGVGPPRALFMDNSGGSEGGSTFTVENVEVQTSAPNMTFIMFSVVTLTDTYNAFHTLTNCINTFINGITGSVGSGFAVEAVDPTNVDVKASNVAVGSIGVGTPCEARVTIDRATTFSGGFNAQLAGASCSLDAKGNLGSFTLGLPTFGAQNIDFGESSYRTLDVTGQVVGAQFPVGAQSCTASGGVDNVPVNVNNNVALDLRGSSFPALFVVTGNATIDRDSWEVSSQAYPEAGGIYTVPFTVSGAPVPFPSADYAVAFSLLGAYPAPALAVSGLTTANVAFAGVPGAGPLIFSVKITRSRSPTP